MKYASSLKVKLKYLILTTGILFLTYGIYRSEVPTVFIKAVNICLECIGIG